MSAPSVETLCLPRASRARRCARRRPPGVGWGWQGKGRDRGAVVARRSPLGEPAVAVPGHSDRRRARASFPPGDSLFQRPSAARERGGCPGWGVQGGRTRRGERRPKRARRARRRRRAEAGAEARARTRSARSPRWGRELSSPLSRMQRPCRGVRCEHKVNAAFSPEGTCERGAAAWERLRVVPLSRMESRARARGSGHARATVPRKTIVALSAWTMERTGPCQRERGAGRRSSGEPRASACKDQDAVTVALAAALRALHLHDGAGARAVAAETAAALR